MRRILTFLLSLTLSSGVFSSAHANADARLSFTKADDKAAMTKEAESLYAKGNSAYSSRNWASAREYYMQSCDAGRQSSCGNVGLMMNDGLGGDKDFKKSFLLFKRACSAKDGFFCTSVGDAYAKGEGVKKNVKTAKKFYKMACALDDSMGCALAKVS